jgi:hypothetical protein
MANAMDRHPLKAPPITHIGVVFDRGPHRRQEALPCTVLRHWLDDRSNRFAEVVSPMGRKLKVTYSEISRAWRPVRWSD